MELLFDFERMEELLKSFYGISGVRYTLMDKTGKIICASGNLIGFCGAMNKDPRGHARCRQCDREAMEKARRSPKSYLLYRCHAGLAEAVIPVRQDGDVLAYIFFGQIAPLDREKGWETVKKAISWLEDQESFRALYYGLPLMEEDKMESCAKVLEACSSYIRMEGLLLVKDKSEFQKLNQYIEEHYASPLTLSAIASGLSMSKTKLCAVASKEGVTVRQLLQDKRMEEGKRLLRGGDMPIGEVARQIGVPDGNYFAKLFKSCTGETPRDYRLRHRKKRLESR